MEIIMERQVLDMLFLKIEIFYLKIKIQVYNPDYKKSAYGTNINKIGIQKTCGRYSK